MQKRHFELVADILNSQMPSKNNIEYNYWLDIVDTFCERFHGENSRFDEDKFRKACGEEHYNEPNEPYPGAWV
jgi:hypothetical protein